MLRRDEFDLIAVGRALLNDPLWLNKVQTGTNAEQKDLNPASFAQLI
jgi:2,4-dienoyl-CoA reductase-like NADH-dependent reductase (Old Yellow Enzyme family)